MNFFFPKNQVSDVLSDSDSDSDTVHDLFRKPLVKKNDFSCYFISSNHFAKHLQTWCFNRKIDETHKNQIKTELLDQPEPHLMGSIQIIRDVKNQVRVINGQHRLNAIQEIIKEDIENRFEIFCLFEVYDTSISDLTNPTESEQEQIVTRFKKANSSLYMKPEEEHDIFCRKLVDLLSKEEAFKKGIVDTEKSVHKPRIVKKDLFELFKIHLSVTLSLEQVILRIKQINTHFKTLTDQDFFGSQPSADRLKRREKAEKIQFFLNCDNHCSTPDKWIKLI